MKLLKNLFVAVILVGAFSTAQAQKVAHIDSEQLLMAMPEVKAMETELQKVQQTYADEYQAQVAAAQAKGQKYQAEQATQTDVKNAERGKEMEDLQLKIQKYGQTAQQELQNKRMDLLKPIVEKATQAIKDVAAEKNVIYVFDSSPGKGVIVFDKGDDLFPAVKAKLGIQ